MPITIPSLDDRTYQDLLDEALARIPVYTPEWTNFNQSDPGVTLIELFAFLTENLLYRANQIPERNRRKFLTLLGVPLQPATSAQGLAVFTNERGPMRTITLNKDLEVRAGSVPFRTTLGLDVLPVEAQVYYKRRLDNPPAQLTAYYRDLYTSFTGQAPGSGDLLLYETTPLVAPGSQGVGLGSQDVVDGSLWVALLARTADQADPNMLDSARAAIGGKTISFGFVPWIEDATLHLVPGGQAQTAGDTSLRFEIPLIPSDGMLPVDPALRVPQYQPLNTSATVDVLVRPGVVQVTLPDPSQLVLWQNLDPLEAGAGDFPPTLEDTSQNDRLITWLRIRNPAGAQARLLWVGANSTTISQRAHVAGEHLPDGSGEPDQTVTLARRPVLPGTVKLTVTPRTGGPEVWQSIDDLMSAGPEVPTPDPRQPPGTQILRSLPVNVFQLDAEAGVLRFGDGTRGRRPPFGASLRADYDYSAGSAGNVGASSINTSPALPAGLKVNNPIPTWGGADAETEPEGEKQVSRYLQHRDRLVTAEDFRTITWRTPGVNLGRVEVIPAFNPDMPLPNEPGDAPGAVTVMLIPSYDPKQPDAPIPDRLFLDTVCAYLDSRRLVTTELYLRGPVYRPIWVSVGIQPVPGASVAVVREAVRQALLQFLSPLPSPGAATGLPVGDPAASQSDGMQGWPLRTPVVDRQLLAVASRVQGVQFITQVLVAQGSNPPLTQINFSGLELPRVAGISVTVGDPVDLDTLRGQGPTPPGGPAGGKFIPVPIVPEECT